jgi:hypothetical protein
MKITYARCLGLIDAKPIGAYTVGQEYEVHEHPDGAVFEIIDDRGDAVTCWWDGDPDCRWQRVERRSVRAAA